MAFQTLQIEADPGSRERSQRAELGEPPPPATVAASFRRRRTCPCPSLGSSAASTPAGGEGEPGGPTCSRHSVPRVPHVTRPGPPRVCPPQPRLRAAPARPNTSSPARPSGMAAAKAEMQLMSPLQISDPFGSFPHSPTMDNYPKLEEMMLLSNGAPQFLGAAGASEGSGGNSSSSSSSGGGGGGGGGSSGSSSGAFNPQGEAGEQPYEHLTAGKRWPTPRISPFATILASSPSPPPCSALFTAAAVFWTSGMQVGFPFPSSGSCVRGMPGDIHPHPHPPGP